MLTLNRLHHILPRKNVAFRETERCRNYSKNCAYITESKKCICPDRSLFGRRLSLFQYYYLFLFFILYIYFSTQNGPLNYLSVNKGYDGDIQ